jgi:hypothetical protein
MFKVKAKTHPLYDGFILISPSLSVILTITARSYDLMIDGHGLPTGTAVVTSVS